MGYIILHVFKTNISRILGVCLITYWDRLKCLWYTDVFFQLEFVLFTCICKATLGFTLHVHFIKHVHYEVSVFLLLLVYLVNGKLVFVLHNTDYT